MAPFTPQGDIDLRNVYAVNNATNLSGSNTGDQTISDATITTTDITDNDVSSSKHGFAPKGDGSATSFLNGLGVYSTPAGGGDVSTSGTPVANDFARFTDATTIEGRSYSEVKSDLSLDNVSNVSTDDTAYNATSWDANSDSATKNSIRDKIETMDTAIGLNTSKVTNVSTNLSEGTSTETTVAVNSSDGTNATLASASTTRAGLLTKAKWDEIVANTSASHAQSHNIASHSDTTATGTELDTLTGGGDTTLHDHDGISENTSARHTQNTDTALGSGAVAADHGTDSTDQIINVSYGTSATPPTASTTTEGSLYVQYTA